MTVFPKPEEPTMNTSSPLEQARFNMIEQQIRTWSVLDQEVLDLLTVVRREEFVPPQLRAMAMNLHFQFLKQLEIT